MPDAWLVLPTYNEAATVRPVVEAALSELRRFPGRHTVLVVDDGSPDGTGRIADELAREHEWVQVLHRPAKDGLARAYLAGFRHALAADAELVLEMDADFSHDPRDLPRLLEASRDADLLLGARYVPGGGVASWGLVRRLLSRGGSWYARTVLGVGVRDLTGGFKCFRREALDALDLDRVRSDGYSFQIELTYRALRAGMRVREIPIVFSERQAGSSKMTAAIALEAVWQVPALKLAARGDDGRAADRLPRRPHLD